MILDVVSTCQNEILGRFLSVFKNVLLILQIAVPIILIIWATVGFISLMSNPEAKNGLKPMFNKFIAAIVVFIIPFLVNTVVGLVDSGDFSACWKNPKADESSVTSPSQSNPNQKQPKPVVPGKYD